MLATSRCKHFIRMIFITSKWNWTWILITSKCFFILLNVYVQNVEWLIFLFFSLWIANQILAFKILLAIVSNILVELAFHRLADYMATKLVHQRSTALLECNSAKFWNTQIQLLGVEWNVRIFFSSVLKSVFQFYFRIQCKSMVNSFGNDN